MKILFGNASSPEEDLYDITYRCYLSAKDSSVVNISAKDCADLLVEGDKREKVFVVYRSDGKTTYSGKEEFTVEFPKDFQAQKPFKNYPDPERKLKSIHESLLLYGGTLAEEYHEQIMAVSYINEDDSVLEIGSNIGRNTLVIASILNDDSRLVTVEMSEKFCETLEKNRSRNSLNFHIENCAISKTKLYHDGYNTSDQRSAVFRHEVKTMSPEDLFSSYPHINFNVLVADCEGALYNIICDTPSFFSRFNKIILENDYWSAEHKLHVNKSLLRNGFKVVYSREGPEGLRRDHPCFFCFYEVWVR